MLHPLSDNKCRWIGLRNHSCRHERNFMPERVKRELLMFISKMKRLAIGNIVCFHPNVRPSDEFVLFRYSRPSCKSPPNRSCVQTINFATPAARVYETVCLRTFCANVCVCLSLWYASVFDSIRLVLSNSRIHYWMDATRSSVGRGREIFMAPKFL